MNQLQDAEFSKKKPTTMNKTCTEEILSLRHRRNACTNAGDLCRAVKAHVDENLFWSPLPVKKFGFTLPLESTVS